jgi:hypothetical protein
LLNADADRADLKSRLIELLLEDRARVYPFAGVVRHITVRGTGQFAAFRRRFSFDELSDVRGLLGAL